MNSSFEFNSCRCPSHCSISGSNSSISTVSQQINGNRSFPRRISFHTLEQYSPLTEHHRKLSFTTALQKTKQGLGNLFADDEQSPEDLIHNLFRVPNKSDAYIGKLIIVLKNHGLQKNDPRFAPMMRKISEIENEKEEKSNEARDPKHWKLSKNDFKRVISESMSLIVQTIQGDLIVPAWAHFTKIIKEIYEECKPITEGKVANYIPQLARVSPDNWGVAICTVDGQRHSFGNSNIPFCVQSVSKAFNYGIAASEMGAEYVHKYVGQEPSGRLFNEICLDSNNKPHNPMVNSGAIIVTSLIQNKLDMADRFEHMINEYRKISGGEYVGFNNAVFLSETNTADRNYALAYFMKENGCFPPGTGNLKEALDFYFQLCSLEVTCEGMAVMASTLANGGVCPLTGERCIGSRPCRDVLSLMNSCGMYDYSGQFAFHVGLPAKSGVSGVMIVVVPNIMGIALWSPALDKMGNSVRGVEFCKRLIQRFNFHNYDSLVHSESPKFDPRARVGEREKAAVVSLLFAAKAADLNTIRRMYMQKVDLEMADYDKRTALHLAASEGHFDVALFLLEIGKVKPDPKDRWNRTPLDDARSAKHTSVALLLERRMCEIQQCQPSLKNNQQPLEALPQTQPPKVVRKSSSMQALTNNISNKEQISTVASSIQQKSYNQNTPNESVIMGQREQLLSQRKPSDIHYNNHEDLQIYGEGSCSSATSNTAFTSEEIKSNNLNNSNEQCYKKESRKNSVILRGFDSINDVIYGPITKNNYFLEDSSADENNFISSKSQTENSQNNDEILHQTLSNRFQLNGVEGVQLVDERITQSEVTKQRHTREEDDEEEESSNSEEEEDILSKHDDDSSTNNSPLLNRRRSGMQWPVPPPQPAAVAATTRFCQNKRWMMGRQLSGNF
uniref:glutaminase n=1 Tax=Meloidogyne incognita TaxID=6306 RepID=A0A914MTS1_MELIC